MNYTSLRLYNSSTSIVLLLAIALSFGNFLGAQSVNGLPSTTGKPNYTFESGFVQNRGQIRDQHDQPNTQVLYLWNGSGLNVQLRANGFSYDTWLQETDSVKLAAYQANPEAPGAADTLLMRMHRVDINFPGANPAPQIIAEEEMESTINIVGGGQNNFQGIAQFGKVTYKNLYPGIDLEFYARSGTDKPIEYNFVVHPGANAALIRMAYAGANQVSLSDKGNILLTLSTGDLEEVIPASWTGEEKQPLSVSYAAYGEGVFGFTIPDYDPAQTLTIDPAPVLMFGTIVPFDASGISYIGEMTADDAGNVYIPFKIRADIAMATSGAYQTVASSGSGGQNMITKFNSRGQMLIATFFHNGTSVDVGDFMLSVAGNSLYAATQTAASGMQTAGMVPYTTGANSFVRDILLAKFNTSNLYPVWITYYGGSGNEFISHITTDNEGNLLVSFLSRSPDLPVTAPFNVFSLPSTTTSNPTVGVAKFNTNGQRIFCGPVINAPSTDYGNDAYPRIRALNDQGFLLYATVVNANPLMSSWNPLKLGNNVASQSFYRNSLVARFDAGGNRVWASYILNNVISDFNGGVVVRNGLVTDNSGKIWMFGLTDFSF
jgi:hypothetical protein